MNSTKNRGFIGFLKAFFAGDEKGQGDEKPVMNKRTAIEKTAAVHNDWKRPVQKEKIEAIFTEGQILPATVKRVDKVVAYFSVAGACSATVSAKACAKGGAVAFGDLAEGQQVRVRVKAWYPRTRQLVLAGVEGIICAVKVKTPNIGKKTSVCNYALRTAKPDYEPLPKGTVILVDGANLLHEFEPTEASKVLRSVADGLKEQGYAARVCLEHRAWKFYSCHQGSDEAGEKFKELCRELEVTTVGREADLAILQILKAVPKSVGLTNDRYADYAKTFPDLVGTSRLRRFSVTKIKDMKLISIDGLDKAITIAEQVEQKVQTIEESVGQKPVFEELVVERPQSARTFSNDVKGGYCGYGNILLAKGNVQGAIRCFRKGAARHQSEGYAGLAEICDTCGDLKGANKFARLGEKLQHRLRDQELRKRRLWAERRRACGSQYALSA